MEKAPEATTTTLRDEICKLRVHGVTVLGGFAYKRLTRVTAISNVAYQLIRGFLETDEIVCLGKDSFSLDNQRATDGNASIIDKDAPPECSWALVSPTHGTIVNEMTFDALFCGRFEAWNDVTEQLCDAIVFRGARVHEVLFVNRDHSKVTLSADEKQSLKANAKQKSETVMDYDSPETMRRHINEINQDFVLRLFRAVISVPSPKHLYFEGKRYASTVIEELNTVFLFSETKQGDAVTYKREIVEGTLEQTSFCAWCGPDTPAWNVSEGQRQEKDVHQEQAAQQNPLAVSCQACNCIAYCGKQHCELDRARHTTECGALNCLRKKTLEITNAPKFEFAASYVFCSFCGHQKVDIDYAYIRCLQRHVGWVSKTRARRAEPHRAVDEGWDDKSFENDIISDVTEERCATCLHLV